VAVRMTAFKPTGKSGYSQPVATTAGPPMTAVSAAAPPGGCRQRNNDIASMAPPTAIPLAIAGQGTISATPTPTRADTTFPPMTGHGCASGLAGTANIKTADAPIGATSQAHAADVPNAYCVTKAVIAIPAVPPMQAIRRSPSEAPAMIGMKIDRTCFALIDGAPPLQLRALRPSEFFHSGWKCYSPSPLQRRQRPRWLSFCTSVFHRNLQRPLLILKGSVSTASRSPFQMIARWLLLVSIIATRMRRAPNYPQPGSASFPAPLPGLWSGLPANSDRGAGRTPRAHRRARGATGRRG